MRRGILEVVIFVVVAAGAFGLAFYLAQTVGLHPLIVPPPDQREKHWMVAAAAASFVVVFDLVVLILIAFKHRREQRAAMVDRGPKLGG